MKIQRQRDRFGIYLAEQAEVRWDRSFETTDWELVSQTPDGETYVIVTHPREPGGMPWNQAAKTASPDPFDEKYQPLRSDIYDEWVWPKRYDQEPVPTPQGVQWFHVSTQPIPLGTLLRPGWGHTPWPDDPYNHGLDNRAGWIWVESDPVKATQWCHWIHQYHPDCFVYHVDPSEGPYPWNGTGNEGWVTPVARVIEELGKQDEKVANTSPHPDWENVGGGGYRHRPTDTSVYPTWDEEGNEYYTLEHEGNDLETQTDPMDFVKHSPTELLQMFNCA